MPDPWNLTPDEWSQVLQSDAKTAEAAKKLLQGDRLPWADTLLELTKDSVDTLDLGSGRGELSAHLALNGKKTTLMDWSQKNLDFSERLYRAANIEGRFLKGDITEALPFKPASFDTVFSCGVFEYFSDGQIRKILFEAFRVARKKVIALVPNAASIAYRVGKWHLETTRQWPWGGEQPRWSLKKSFRAVSQGKTTEFCVATRLSLDFLAMRDGEKIRNTLIRLFNLKHHPNPSFFRQGYLLITVGEKSEIPK